eukprot:4913811-Prymnesium_polylepis.2
MFSAHSTAGRVAPDTAPGRHHRSSATVRRRCRDDRKRCLVTGRVPHTAPLPDACLARSTRRASVIAGARAHGRAHPPHGRALSRQQQTTKWSRCVCGVLDLVWRS